MYFTVEDIFSTIGGTTVSVLPIPDCLLACVFCPARAVSLLFGVRSGTNGAIIFPTPSWFSSSSNESTDLTLCGAFGGIELGFDTSAIGLFDNSSSTIESLFCVTHSIVSPSCSGTLGGVLPLGIASSTDFTILRCISSYRENMLFKWAVGSLNVTQHCVIKSVISSSFQC